MNGYRPDGVEGPASYHQPWSLSPRFAHGTAVMRIAAALLVLLGVGLALAQDKKDKKDKPKEAPVVKPREGKTEKIDLFDGKSLDGWEGYSDLWSVKDGVIVAKNTEP